MTHTKHKWKLVSNNGDTLGLFRTHKLAMDRMNALYSIGAYEEMLIVKHKKPNDYLTKLEKNFIKDNKQNA